MTNLESWEKECLTKKRYDNYFLAERVAKKRYKESNIKLNVYRCTSCGNYHLTKQNQNRNDFKILKVVR